MTTKLLLPALILALCGSGACTHYYYATNTLRTPFLEKQHDTRMGLGVIGGDEFNGWEAYAVYSPVKYGAIMINHMALRSGNNPNNSDWGKGQLTELALGGYYPTPEHLSLSLFAGWGKGKVLNVYKEEARSDLRFERTFIQPGLAFQRNYIRFGLAVRLNRLQYVRGDIDYEIGEPHLSTIAKIEEANPMYFPETGISFGLGKSPVWVDLSFNTNTMPRRDDFGFARSTTSMTACIDLDYAWRKAKKVKS